MYTIDASVHVSAYNPAEAQSAVCPAFLERMQENRVTVFSPTLLPVEVAAAVAGGIGDRDRALALAAALRGIPNQLLIPLDDALADRAARLAATARLRVADAVYAAVAQQYNTTLVTLDRQQLEQLPPLVRVIRPTEALCQMAAVSRQPGTDE